MKFGSGYFAAGTKLTQRTACFFLTVLNSFMNSCTSAKIRLTGSLSSFASFRKSNAVGHSADQLFDHFMTLFLAGSACLPYRRGLTLLIEFLTAGYSQILRYFEHFHKKSLQPKNKIVKYIHKKNNMHTDTCISIGDISLIPFFQLY